jgi:hypothetical protein
MCHPNPGPRCSNHAYREYVAALSRFENEKDRSRKISLGKILEEKTLQLDSTPRGQSRLRQEINTAEDESDKLIVRGRLTVGEITRKSQVEAWKKFSEDQNHEIAFSLKENGIKNKYEIATGIAFNRIVNLSEAQGLLAEVTGVSNLKVSNTETEGNVSVLTIPAKYQGVWGSVTKEESGFAGDDSLTEVLNANVDYIDLSDEDQVKAFTWLENVLKEKEYKLVASVDSLTEKTTLLTTEELSKQYSICLKLRKRLGGTTFYGGSVEDLKVDLAGTVFETGTIEQAGLTPKVTLVLDLPHYPKKDCFISNDLYLSWNEEGYYQARQRHVSKTYDVFVVLERTKELPAGLTIEARKTILELASLPNSENAETN